MELINQPLGVEGSLEISFKEGKLLLSVKHAHASGSVGIVAEQDAGYFLDKLAEAIPGDWDKAVIEVLKGIIRTM